MIRLGTELSIRIVTEWVVLGIHQHIIENIKITGKTFTGDKS